MQNRIASLIGFGVIMTVTQACFFFPEPKFPLTPQIEFLEIQHTADDVLDEYRITIHIKDGDGDLGLDSAAGDNSGKFGSTSVFYHNSFITMFKERDGVFDTAFFFNP